MQLRSKTTSRQSEPQLLSPEEAIALFNQLLILDVQNPKYATNTIPKAHRLNVDILLEHIAKDQPILLICLYGQRSLAAAKQLVQRGYRSVYVLKGGVLAWGQAGHTIQRLRVSG
ncbi:rhodanese-like domain-containing protein [Leptolyngbya ohadii]|uniref:rhodanese-like domain-containing protein n=1 Tax=Leptolyngbya ohadii TaxID=1962290 RepID=UPI000B5A1E07|nr:rhodanese-like domain-containing protein [Leptolyngbya ohadii]